MGYGKGQERGRGLQMKSSERSRLVELDGVRALSIVAVLVLHGTYGRFLPGGFLGVDIFFVLSGFLITRLLIAEDRVTGQVDLRAFYMRRVFRILPPLILCLALALPLRHDSPADRLFVGAAALGFFANFVSAEQLGNLGPLWSLAIEEQFYLVWPFVFAWTWRRAPRLTIALAIGVVGSAMIVRGVLAQGGWPAPEIYTFTFARLDGIMMGCVLALAEPWLRLPSAWVLRTLAWGSAAAIVACLFLAERMSMSVSPWAFTAFAALVAVLLFALSRLDEASLLRRAFSHPVPVWLGRRSYGIYLYHYPIFKAAEALRVPGSLSNFVMVLTLNMVLTLIVAALSWRYVESPAIDFRKRAAMRRRMAASV